jgi:hypothetical protein
MRIVYTGKITAIISETDVSYNSLFIGLWTTAEVSLVFVVACGLCIPKLIQYRSSRRRMALTCATDPTLPPGGTSRGLSDSRKDSLSSDSRKSMHEVETVTKLERMESETSFHEREVWNKQQSETHLRRHPSEESIQSGAGGMQRTRSSYSSHVQDGFQAEPLHMPDPWRDEANVGMSEKHR